MKVYVSIYGEIRSPSKIRSSIFVKSAMLVTNWEFTDIIET